LGEWCNLGADTNTSNLKNTYGERAGVELCAESMIDTGLQFCGLLMGDHSKSGINTMFNTGTVVGVAPTCSAVVFHPSTSRFLLGWRGRLHRNLRHRTGVGHGPQA
jgi:hypothetical protein